jgi:hypothetical protein
MMRKLSLVALPLLIATPTSAHRLDEYLQGAIISVAKSRLEAEITLTPGVAVFPAVIASIDTNTDGTISEAEQQAYAEHVLRDLSLAIDGRPLTPHLTSAAFPAIGDMKEGRGEIRIAFSADLPRGGASRKLTFENDNQTKISVYQVNVLVPRDPDIRIMSQNRNYSQSVYELNFEQADKNSGSVLAYLSNIQGLLATVALLAAAWLALFWSLRGLPLKTRAGL